MQKQYQCKRKREKKKKKQRKEGKLSTYKNKPNSTHLHIQPYTVYFAMFTEKPSTYCNGKLLKNFTFSGYANSVHWWFFHIQ